jgi:enoyl-CoA hydratase/carnithine racemase
MKDVTHQVYGATLLVEINRPQSANALRRQTILELESELDAAEASESNPDRLGGNGIGAVVITGSSGRFSAGADLTAFTASLEDLEFDDALEQFCRRITHSPLPVVAAVEGACFGAAVDLAWACDAVVVSEQARFALPSTRLGILYNPLSVARLHSRLGSSTLRRLMVLQQELAGRDLPPGSAIVTRPGTAASTAVRLVQAVAADRRAMAATKALLACLDGEARFDPASWQGEREVLVASPARREALEGLRASITRKNRPGTV